MTITLASCTERPARADIDPMLNAYYQELVPKLVAMNHPPPDIPFWIDDFWHHADEFLPPAGSTWIARNAAGLPVGMGTLRRIRPDTGEMKRLYVRPETRGHGIARRLVHARIDDARAMGWKHLLCDTIRTNVEMQGLYQSVGFRFVDPYPESATIMADPKTAVRLVFMQLDL